MEATLSGSERQGQRSVVIAGAGKSKGRRDQNSGLFSDQKSATLVAGNLNQKYKKKGKEEKKEKKAHPRPLVTSPVRKHGEKSISARGSSSGKSERKRGRRGR